MKRKLILLTALIILTVSCGSKTDDEQSVKSQSDTNHEKVLQSFILQEPETEVLRSSCGAIDFNSLNLGMTLFGTRITGLTYTSDEFGLTLQGDIELTGKLSRDREYDCALELLVNEFDDVKTHFRVLDITLNLFGRITFDDEDFVLSKLSAEQVKKIEEEGESLNVKILFSEIGAAGKKNSSYITWGKFKKFIEVK